MARAFVAAGTTPSVTIALARGGQTLVMASWGKADLEQSVDATPASVYEIGSATKQFTSAAIMQLVEQGKVTLEEPINTYLTGLPEAWRAVTVHQLLNHTSGIPNYTAAIPWSKHWAADLAERFTGPLGLSSLRICDGGSIIPHRAHGY